MSVADLARAPTALGLATELSNAAHASGLNLCHWKSNQRLGLSVTGKSDLDFSIPPDQEPALQELLGRFGFIQFQSRPWQRYRGVTDWLSVDPATGILLHVHLHNRLLTGAKAVKEQDLPWLDAMNSDLRQDQETGLWIPPRAFEAHLFFAREAIKSRNVRGILLSGIKRTPISEFARGEMAWLLSGCTEGDLDRWGRVLWGASRWDRMRPAFHGGRLWETDAFRALRREVMSALSEHRHGSFLTHSAVFLVKRSTKRLHAARAHLAGTTTSGKRVVGRRAPVIALVGSDGAGKSTVAAELRRWLSWKADVAFIYCGTNHGWFRGLRGAVARAQRNPRSPAGPKDGDARTSSYPVDLQALKWAVMSRLRLHLLRKGQRLSRNGTIVIADRYPQTEIYGTYDGPSRPNMPGLGPLGRLLQRYEHRNFAQIEKIRPDLIIKLVANLDVALARKPDHDPISIARKIEATRELAFGGTPVVEIDASLPLAAVILETRRHVWAAISGRTG